MKEFKKKLRKAFKKITNREFLSKAVVIAASLALLSSSVLPFILR
jgi:hypothetical protein